jgi:hypothetical protein
MNARLLALLRRVALRVLTYSNFEHLCIVATPIAIHWLQGVRG